MKAAARLPLRLAPGLRARTTPFRTISSTTVKAADVAPALGTGPPPQPPTPAAANAYERVERRRRQAQLLKDAKEIRNVASGKASGGLKKRFWKDVDVKEVDGQLQIHLDERPLRHPTTKDIINLPKSKPALAAALALEWDMLESAQQATRQHLIPLTSLVCRVLDIQADDAQAHADSTKKIRSVIAATVLRYLDTDSLLCWAPPAGPHDLKNDKGESLREVQKKTADEIVTYLTTGIWPGITIEPVLDGESLLPRKQGEGVREVVQGWVMGLNAWEIAGLERAVLAGKSLVAAARFVAEWTDGDAKGQNGVVSPTTKFGVEEAAKATSLEVDWQTLQWGEVEDTHDVNKEDVRRQLGSVMLLVSGTGKEA